MAKVDVTKEIRRAVDTGEVLFGQKETQKSILLGHAKMIVLAKNCPKSFAEKITAQAKMANINSLEFEENGLELGSVCGKPFNVSVLAVKDFGKSTLEQAFDEKEQNATEKGPARQKAKTKKYSQKKQ